MKANYTKAQARACDWVEDFTHENGNYWNYCVVCERQFVGHKRRGICKLCAEDSALALLRELNDALVIPGWLQPRVDALLDRAEEKT